MDQPLCIRKVASKVLAKVNLRFVDASHFKDALIVHVEACPKDNDFLIERRAIYCNDCAARVAVGTWTAMNDLSAYTSHCRSSHHALMRERRRGPCRTPTYDKRANLSGLLPKKPNYSHTSFADFLTYKPGSSSAHSQNDSEVKAELVSDDEVEFTHIKKRHVPQKRVLLDYDENRRLTHAKKGKTAPGPSRFNTGSEPLANHPNASIEHQPQTDVSQTNVEITPQHVSRVPRRRQSVHSQPPLTPTPTGYNKVLVSPSSQWNQALRTRDPTVFLAPWQIMPAVSKVPHITLVARTPEASTSAFHSLAHDVAVESSPPNLLSGSRAPGLEAKPSLLNARHGHVQPSDTSSPSAHHLSNASRLRGKNALGQCTPVSPRTEPSSSQGQQSHKPSLASQTCQPACPSPAGFPLPPDMFNAEREIYFEVPSTQSRPFLPSGQDTHTSPYALPGPLTEVTSSMHAAEPKRAVCPQHSRPYSPRFTVSASSSIPLDYYEDGSLLERQLVGEHDARHSENYQTVKKDLSELDQILQNSVFASKLNNIDSRVTNAEREHFTAAAAKTIEFMGNTSVSDACKLLGIEESNRMTVVGLANHILLMPHQVLGVAFMVRQEGLKRFNGGIVADEMGLGKTVQSIALMCHNRPTVEDIKEKRTCTLLLGPVALLEQWRDEIEEKTQDGLFRCLLYHGSKKPRSLKELQQYDIILTTYQTLAFEWVADDETAKLVAKRQAKRDGVPWTHADEDNWSPQAKSGLLFQMNWHRIIIDEAHNIRNKITRISRAVCRLRSRTKWCLTGTPILNNLGDAFSLVRFLGVRPYSDWSTFREDVIKFEKRTPDRAAKKTLAILSPLMLRRKKDSKLDGKPLLELPVKHIYEEVLEFDDEERSIYNAIELRMQVQFKKFLRQGTVLKNYNQILVMLLRLRQICSHPALVAENSLVVAISESGDEMRERERGRALGELGERSLNLIKNRLLAKLMEDIRHEKEGKDVPLDECPVCMSTLCEDTDKITPCGHAYCSNCIQQQFDTQTADPATEPSQPTEIEQIEKPCHTCRQPFSINQTYSLVALQPTQEELHAAMGLNLDCESDGEEVVNHTGRSHRRGKRSSAESDEGDEPKAHLNSRKAPNAFEDQLPALRELKKGDGSAPNENKRMPARMTKLRSRRTEDLDDGLGDFIVDDDEVEYESEDIGRQERARPNRESRGRDPKFSSETGTGYEDSDDSVSGGHMGLLQMPTESSDARNLDSIMKKFKKNREENKIIPSTKLQRMLELLREILAKDESTLIFSQFTTCLDIIGSYLTENGIAFVRYSGDMSKFERLQSVDAFQKKAEVKVMLMSIKTAGVGLNLVRANHLISTDLSFAPAVEHQAFDRIHRMGQTKECHIYRLLISNSIEDRLLQIQTRKMCLANGALGEGKDTQGRANRKLTVNDLASLFGLGF